MSGKPPGQLLVPTLQPMQRVFESPAVLPRRFGDRIEEAISEATRAAPARVTRAETFLRQKGVNVYQCPLCGKTFRHDDEYEPACTGWNPTTDEHPLTVMKLVRVEPPIMASYDPGTILGKDGEPMSIAEPPAEAAVEPVPAAATYVGIQRFKDKHKGEDVYVLAAGGSLNYLFPEFFLGKTVVAVNSAARSWKAKDDDGIEHMLVPTYVVVKEHVEEAIPNHIDFPGTPIICAHGPYGREYADLPPELISPDVFVYDHPYNKSNEFDVARDWPVDPDQLVVSMSTITTAMHFSAYMGAANILVVGHDVGKLGDGLYVNGYRQTDPGEAQPEWMPGWLAFIERQSLAVKRELIRRYGVRVYGLSPFITPNLDGVTYVGGSNRINAW